MVPLFTVRFYASHFFSKKIFVLLCKTYAKVHLYYCIQAWSLYYYYIKEEPPNLCLDWIVSNAIKIEIVSASVIEIVFASIIPTMLLTSYLLKITIFFNYCPLAQNFGGDATLNFIAFKLNVNELHFHKFPMLLSPQRWGFYIKKWLFSLIIAPWLKIFWGTPL